MLKPGQLGEPDSILSKGSFEKARTKPGIGTYL